MSPKLSIIFCLLMLTSSALWSEELTLNTKVTENGYNKFCATDAKKIIENLNAKSEEKLRSVKDITIQIDSLNAQKNIIDGLSKIKDQYLSSLKNISDDEKNSIGEFKNLLKSSVTLSAVSMLMKDNSKNDPANVTSIESLCNSGKNSETPLCKSIEFGFTQNRLIGNNPKLIISTLNSTLNNFKYSYNLVKDADKANLDIEIETFYKSLNGDKNISPDTTIEILAKSQGLIPELGKAESEMVEKCLKDDVQSCTNLMTKSANRNSFVSRVNSRLKDFREGLNAQKYNEFFKKYDSKKNAGDRFKDLIDSITEKSQKLPTLNTKNKILSDDLINNFASYCKSESSEYNIGQCLQNNQAIADSLQTSEAKNQAELKRLNEKLSTTLNKDGSLEALEKMKKYVGEKYLRSCKVPTDEAPQINSTLCESAKKVIGEDATEQLSGKMLDIVGKLSVDNNLSSTRGELGAHSRDELNVYVGYCSNTSLANNPLTKNICSDIYNESNRIADLKETKDWAKFHEQYWVEYNPKSKKGYDVYEKKSNLRIVGEGVSQSIGKIYPTWLYNYQLKNQIDFMTNQAIYQKQINYMYSYGSPWMTSYFQDAYFNSNYLTNPFNNFNLGTTTGLSTTGTTTTTTTSKTGGFNFN